MTPLLPQPTGVTDPLLNLALALVVGLIIGLERGWQERKGSEGSRIAGLRTFGLIGLLGGLWAMLAGTLGNVLFGFAFLAFAVLMAISHYAEARESKDYGVTTLVAALITFALGAMSVQGQHVIAGAGAVVTAVLLSAKPALHRWLQRIEAAELYAALKLLLISVVILPVLPNQGYGPWNALNPYEIWWLVVLIAAISFAAYAAVKVTGTEHGLLLMGLLGGLVSSTAVSVHLARLAKTVENGSIVAAGVLVASGTMFVRVLLVLVIINRTLAGRLAVPFLAMASTLFVAAAVYARSRRRPAVGKVELHNPVEVFQAVKFGAVLTGILLLSKAMETWLGQYGLYVLAGIAGLADVDAMTVSVARMVGLPVHTAAIAALIVTMVNTATKGFIVRSIAGRALGWKVLGPMGISLIAGAALVFVI